MKRDLPESLRQLQVSMPLTEVLQLLSGENVLLQTTARRALPSHGGALEGGLYAGTTVHDNDPFELILLPGEFEGSWSDADAWAKQQGGELPSRFDALVLFKYLKSEFKPEWYWTAEPYAGDADYAWIQTFVYGRQVNDHKSSRYRARVVRRVPI